MLSSRPKDDDDLADRMWESNLRHGVQYSRDQRQTHGLKLHERELSAKEIAERVGVRHQHGLPLDKRTTREARDRSAIKLSSKLAEEGKTQQEIADQLGIPRQTTVAAFLPKIPKW